MNWSEKYRYCRVCEKPLKEDDYEYAIKKHEKQSCSVECSKKERLDRYACCEKAKFRNCVCIASTECEDHGIRCYGSHD
jgi:hypothetical protein